MDDFGMLARDFGYRPQGKSAPMKTEGGDRRSRPPSASSPFAADDDKIFNDVFGGPPKYTNNTKSTPAMSDFDYDSIFKNSASNNDEAKSKSTSSTLPVYDKPVYDDDIFDGLPGLKSKSMSSSATAAYEDNIFASMAASSPKRSQPTDHFDDLLGNLGRKEKVEPPKHNTSKSSRGLDDLIPGFGGGSPASSYRSSSEPKFKSTGSVKETSNPMDDPFVVLESTSTPVTSTQDTFTDPLEDIGKVNRSGSTKAGGSSAGGGMFDDIDPLNGFGKSQSTFSSEKNSRGKDQSPSKEGSGMGRTHSSVNSVGREATERSSFRYSETQPGKKTPFDDFQESHQTMFDMPAASKDSHKSFDHASSPNSQVNMSPTSEEHVQQADDIWLTVYEIPLFTQPTRAPPPSRPPPPIPRHASKSERGSFASNTRKVGNDYSSSPNSAKYSQSPRPFQSTSKSPMSTPFDELDNFAMGKMPTNDDNIGVQSNEEMDSNSAAAAMKEAMDRAEAKFRHAKEVREREYAKASRNKDSVQDEQAMEEELKRERLDRERQQREREEEEREQRRLEKERMREIEREKARQAVERATREARERAAAEARERAAAEARLKAERAAVQRAQAEARERAAVEAKERAERAAAEARERATAEARERAAAEAREKEAKEKAAVARAEADARRRAERAAVERVAAEARERAAAEARDRAAAAAAARMNQQKNDNDLENFFSMGSRPSSAPRPRANSSDSTTDPLSQSRRGPEGAQRTSTTGVSSNANMRKASSATNIIDDLGSIFGAASSAGEFQDLEGETEERRRARLERHQRTQERAAKALAEKNQRDLQSQREQEERHRIAETLDIEIKRWAAGKEGNLRALLSTLQYVLWPECGWQPVSLTDLITGANVKKAYRKATLCIHPDKVQQKGANLQQKYIAEKVFDLLKEAWNKFNSEELF